MRLKVHDPGEPLATEPVQQKLLKYLVDSAFQSDLSQTVYKLDPAQLVRRYLPPGTSSDLYHLYVGFQSAQGLSVAAPSTFYKVLSESGWKKALNVCLHTLPAPYATS